MSWDTILEGFKYAAGAAAGMLYTAYGQPYVARFAAWLNEKFN